MKTMRCVMFGGVTVTALLPVEAQAQGLIEEARADQALRDGRLVIVRVYAKRAAEVIGYIDAEVWDEAWESKGFEVTP